jgi:hypothetical protein
MSIAHLLDHVCVVWRRTESLGLMGETIAEYAVVYSDLACASDGQATGLTPTSQGVQLTGGRELYFDVGPIFERRDLIEVHSGPTAPFIVEVRSWDAFRGDHVEVSGEEWNGKLPEVGGS